MRRTYGLKEKKNFFLIFQDVDECSVSSSCPVNSTCTNTPGAFFCSCNVGYILDGHTCILGTSLLKKSQECA